MGVIMNYKKIILIIISLILCCSIITGSTNNLRPYTITVIVWDESGNLVNNIPVVFEYNDQLVTLHTVNDGSVSFSLLNFNGVNNDSNIIVSCEYGFKNVPINYKYGITGVTFNEPSKNIAIGVFEAFGFFVISVGSGIYYLLKKRGDN